MVWVFICETKQGEWSWRGNPVSNSDSSCCQAYTILYFHLQSTPLPGEEDGFSDCQHRSWSCVFVRYGLDKEAQCDIMLDQSSLTLTTAEETLKLSLASRYTVTWKGCAVLCTDGAHAMVSNKNDCSMDSSCCTGNKIYPLFHTWGMFSPSEIFF